MAKIDWDKNWGVVGHQAAVSFLQTSIKNNRVASAYLIYGAPHLGRQKICSGFIAALLCLNLSDGRPCGACLNCQQVEKGIHPDVLTLNRLRDPKTDKLNKNIKIDDLREFKDRLSRSSFLNSYQIALIPEAELLSVESANAALKLLEEPGRQVVLILLAANIDNLPSTILSRCQKLKLEPVSREAIYDYLVTLGAERGLADELSYLALGRPGVAISYFREPETLSDYKDRAAKFLDLIGAGNRERFLAAAEMGEDEEGVIARSLSVLADLEIWASIVRDALLIRHSQEEIPPGLCNLWLLDRLKTAKIATVDSGKLRHWLGLIETTRRLLSQNVNPQLALENLLLNLV
ncbi:MAG: DNA polymerase III subunit [Patescibacteria group bacterium]|jgi:DNA polymerase-3 subunit delta'